METTRVLVANELRSYREAIAQVIRNMRPDVEVHETEPEDLDLEVTNLHPDLVVCSEATDGVRNGVPIWVELYRDCGVHSEISIRGEITRVDDVQLADLLTLLDETRDHAATPG